MHESRFQLRLAPVASVALAAVLAAACSGSALAPSPSPQPSPADETLLLRLTTTQALPPIEQFGWGFSVAITSGGVVVAPGAVPAIYPGPLLTPLWGRQLTENGWAKIVAQARAHGLLVVNGNFAGDAAMPGAALGRIDIFADGRTWTITGDPNSQIMCITTPCDPAPGTPPAFGAFWRAVSDLASWMPGDLGKEAPYRPSAYALLIGPAPVAEAGIAPGIADWPLEAALASFGDPVANTGLRCGIVAGADAEALRPALEAANQLTQWTQDPTTSATVGLQVRSLLPGENPCNELFGLG